MQSLLVFSSALVTNLFALSVITTAERPRTSARRPRRGFTLRALDPILNNWEREASDFSSGRSPGGYPEVPQKIVAPGTEPLSLSHPTPIENVPNSSRPARLGALAQAIQRARLSRAMSGSSRRYPLLEAMASFIVPPLCAAGCYCTRHDWRFRQHHDPLASTRHTPPATSPSNFFCTGISFGSSFTSGCGRQILRIIERNSSADESLHHSASYERVKPPASARLTRGPGPASPSSAFPSGQIGILKTLLRNFPVSPWDVSR